MCKNPVFGLSDCATTGMKNVTDLTSPDWNAQLDKALRLFARKRGCDLVKHIRPIVLANLKIGRFNYYLKRHPEHQLTDYVDYVADHYQQWAAYIILLQQTRSDQIWRLLHSKLTVWARHYLSSGKYNLAQGEAEDIAHEAMLVLITARFPYDTHFDPWARRILRNTCAQMHRKAKEVAELREQQQSEQGPTPVRKLEESVAIHQDLLRSIETMSNPDRQRFLLLHYYQDLSFAEIQPIMNKTLSALYKLHFDALEEVREIYNRQGQEGKASSLTIRRRTAA